MPLDAIGSNSQSNFFPKNAFVQPANIRRQ
jgi:hypothetical protein